MRYIVIFSDRSTKRVTPDAAREFMRAMHDGGNVLYRGQMYAGRTIHYIKTIFGFYQEKLAAAQSSGGYFCKYGFEHLFRADCACKDAKFEKMFTPEELLELPLWSEDRENSALLLVSPTQADAKRIQ